MINNVCTLNRTKPTILQCKCNQQRLRSVCTSTRYIYKASFLDSREWYRRCILYDQRRVWSECAVAAALLIPLWTARLSKVNTINECSYQNVQLRRLTRVFAHRTRCFVKPRDCKRYTISEGSDQTDVQAQSVQADPSHHTSFIVGFAMRKLMRDLFLQTITLSTLGKIFSRWHFEIFFSFFQENRICISCKLSPLHEMSNPIFFVIKTNNKFVVCWICPESGNPEVACSIPASTKCWARHFILIT